MYPVMCSGITNTAVLLALQGKISPGTKQLQFPPWDKEQDALVCTPGPPYLL